MAKERPNEIQLRILRDFTLPELRQYLRLFGRVSDDLPADVRETLRRPLLAGTYTKIDTDPSWAPRQEYRLYEEYWRWLQKAGDQNRYPGDFVRIKRLALTLLDEEAQYPWRWEQLEQAGFTDESFQRLEQVGWWSRVDGRFEVWHDRLLSWALAEAVSELGSAEDLAIWLRRDHWPADQRILQILGYLLLDVLWLLSGNQDKSHLVPDLIVGIEDENRPFGWYGFYERGLATLGLRIVPCLIERLRRLPNGARYAYVERAVKALLRILDQEPNGSVVLPPLLKESSRIIRRVAIGALTRHPHSQAIPLLWDQFREASC